MISCVTKPKSDYTIILPPKPVHPEMNENPKSVKELGEIINTYDALVKEWETWGDDVTRIIEESEEWKSTKNTKK